MFSLRAVWPTVPLLNSNGIIYNTAVKPLIVIDTNVFISAFRSRRGASFKLVSMIGSDRFDITVSVPLVLEYESVAKRQRATRAMSEEDIENILDYVCSVAHLQKIFFLWRPFLRDPDDDMLLELAVASEADFIVTHNIGDFTGIERFGVLARRPSEFLKEIGVLK